MRDRAQSDDDADSGRRTTKAPSGDRAAWGAMLAPAPRPAAAHGRVAARPAASGTDRSVGCDSGGVRRGCPPAAGVCQGSVPDAALPLAAVSDGPNAPGNAPAPPGAQARDAGREISIGGGRLPPATSAALAAQLLGRDTRASEAAIRAERKLRLESALNSMDQIDREVLALRHFEQLTNTECARLLGLSDSAATKRYIRALRRLKEILTSLPGGAVESWT